MIGAHSLETLGTLSRPESQEQADVAAATLRASATPAPPVDGKPANGESVLPAEVAKAQIHQMLSGRRRASTTHWKAGTAPAGDPNPRYKAAIAAQAGRDIEAEPSR